MPAFEAISHSAILLILVYGMREDQSLSPSSKFLCRHHLSGMRGTGKIQRNTYQDRQAMRAVSWGKKEVEVASVACNSKNSNDVD